MGKIGLLILTILVLVGCDERNIFFVEKSKKCTYYIDNEIIDDVKAVTEGGVYVSLYYNTGDSYMVHSYRYSKRCVQVKYAII